MEHFSAAREDDWPDLFGRACVKRLFANDPQERDHQHLAERAAEEAEAEEEEQRAWYRHVGLAVDSATTAQFSQEQVAASLSTWMSR